MTCPWYQGEEIVFATAHQKDLLFAKAFQESLGARVLPCPGIDTDQFGTFSGEIPRDPDLRTVLRRKATLAQTLTGHRLALASEGSFSQHPLLANWATNHETVYFVDFDRDVEVFLSRSTHLTSFAARQVSQESELWTFAEEVGFPQQALLLRETSPGGKIFKGLQSAQEVEKAWRELQGKGKTSLFIETDNRAHLNPQRRQFLTLLAGELAQVIASPCPSCQGPGFQINGTQRGLLCRDCGSPTALVKTELWSCGSKACLYEEERGRADGLTHADPRDCNFCNP